MSHLDHDIRAAARRCLREGKASLVLGFERGSLPMRSRPSFIRREEDVERLIWDGFCETNLARYLPKRKERVAIVAKGCDARAVVELIKENQIARDQVIILGVSCKGMLDRRRIQRHISPSAVTHTEDHGDKLITAVGDSQEIVSRSDYLYDHCRTCTHPTPIVYDVLLGQTEGAELTVDQFGDVNAFAALSQEERWQYFVQETSKCIRCYACRNACPLCYCTECFVDASQPQWVGKSTGLSDTMIFHLLRAFHLAGRCVACGACEQACPMGVDIRKLNRKLQKDVAELFHYEAGCSLEEVTPLATYRADDPQPTMVEP